MQPVSKFDWVTAHSQCSLPDLFGTLAECIDTDVNVANRLSGQKIKFTVQAEPTKIIVKRDDKDSVVFELSETEIKVRPGKTSPFDSASKPFMFSAKPYLDESGECMVEVDHERLKLWQFRRRALGSLFFGH